MTRDLEWDGCLNVRDLGGLATTDGQVTTWGSIVRSDNPAALTARGWTALHDFGIRTIVTLRAVGAPDREPDPRRVPADVDVAKVIMEDATDRDFRRRCVDSGLWGTPLYYGAMLEHWPERCVAAVGAVANASPGGVVVSCGHGRDRTGLVVFLLLALVGVSADDIADDWMRSVERLQTRDPTYERTLREVLDHEKTTVTSAFADMLALDPAARLRDGGLSDDEIGAIRNRLLA